MHDDGTPRVWIAKCTVSDPYRRYVNAPISRWMLRATARRCSSVAFLAKRIATVLAAADRDERMSSRGMTRS